MEGAPLGRLEVALVYPQKEVFEVPDGSHDWEDLPWPLTHLQSSDWMLNSLSPCDWIRLLKKRVSCDVSNLTDGIQPGVRQKVGSSQRVIVK